MTNLVRSTFLILIVLPVGSCISRTTETPSLIPGPTNSPATPPAFVRDGKGNVIKADGWPIPTLPITRKYEPTILETQGRKVEGLRFWFFPKDKMVVTIPKYWEEGEMTYRVTQISELRAKNQHPYCYNFFVTRDWSDPGNHPAVSTFFAYRDDDGDGIFETLAQDCALPAWVE